MHICTCVRLIYTCTCTQVIFEPSAGYEPRAELHVSRLNEHYISTNLGDGQPLFSNCDEEVALDALVQKADALGLSTNTQAKG
jgi:hypothetical protein